MSLETGFRNIIDEFEGIFSQLDTQEKIEFIDDLEDVLTLWFEL